MDLMSRLLGQKTSIPGDEVVYAVGDVHGRADLLARLHDIIEQELAATQPAGQATVVYLGDYIDRGPDGKAVIDRLLRRPVRGATSVFLKGNHEDAMLRFLAGENGGEGWLSMGGGTTVRSYGVSLHDGGRAHASPAILRCRLRQAIPPAHMAFLRGLNMMHEIGDYLFVHAGIRPGYSLQEQDPRDLLWIRREFLASRRHHGKTVVHGHSSGRRVVVKHNRICVDTAAYATDRLSCLVLEGASHRIISAEA